MPAFYFLSLKLGYKKAFYKCTFLAALRMQNVASIHIGAIHVYLIDFPF